MLIFISSPLVIVAGQLKKCLLKAGIHFFNTIFKNPDIIIFDEKFQYGLPEISSGLWNSFCPEEENFAR